MKKENQYVEIDIPQICKDCIFFIFIYYSNGLIGRIGSQLIRLYLWHLMLYGFVCLRRMTIQSKYIFKL